MLILLLLPGSVAAEFWQQNLNRTDWERQLAARNLTGLNVVQGLMQRFEERDGMQITIRYPGGDAGSHWAADFRDWMVSLGIPSRFMVLEPGSGGLDILHISLLSE